MSPDDLRVPALPPLFADWFARRGSQPHAHQLGLLAADAADASALLIAPTGGGKTLAGFLPTLIALAQEPREGPAHALCLAAQGARRRYPSGASSTRW